MSGFSNPLVGGGGALVYPAIHSPNFVISISGWTINKDGSAEFDNLTIRGTFFGTDFILNSAGLFLYSGVPAAGNLIVSICGQLTADPFGTTTPQGIASIGGAGTLTAVLNAASLVLTKLSGAFAPPQIALSNNATGDGSTLATTGLAVVAAAVASILRARVTGDTSQRIAINQNGTITWGPGSTAADATLYRSSPALLASDPIACNIAGSAESPHAINVSPGYVNGWTDGGRVPGKFRLVAAPENSVEICGSLTVPAGVAAGQQICNALPAAYRLASNQSIPARNLTGNVTVWLSYGPGGTLVFAGPAASVAAGNILDYGRTMPLNF